MPITANRAAIAGDFGSGPRTIRLPPAPSVSQLVEVQIPNCAIVSNWYFSATKRKNMNVQRSVIINACSKPERLFGTMNVTQDLRRTELESLLD